MKVGVFSSPDCDAHRGYTFLAEGPGRLANLRELFRELQLEILPAPPPATSAMLELAHGRGYVAHIAALSKNRVTGQMGDFAASMRSPYLRNGLRAMTGTYRAAAAAAGCVVEAVREVAAGQLDRAFCAIRPPGHHAGIVTGEDFCFFNNVAIGALDAAKTGKRVAIVDFDRHHGNGTEQIVAERGRGKVLFISSFQDNCRFAQRAEKSGPRRNIIAIPIPAESAFEQVEALYAAWVVPAIKAFKPDLLMLSAGFDVPRDNEPKGGMILRPADFEPLTGMLVAAAQETCGGRVISVLEGMKGRRDAVSYHLEALRR